jgi:hypothetical protein
MLSYDVLIDVKFFSTDKGGRKSPTPEKFFSCPLEIDGVKYDCRLFLGEIGSISPGQSKLGVPVKFLDSNVVLKLSVGMKFYLWEIGYIAEGVISAINMGA